MMKTLRLFFTICFALSAASLVAQSRHYNSQTLGMGGGGTAFIDGYHANFLNPANLMINNTGRKPRTQLGLFGGFGVTAGGSLVNIGAYNTFLTEGLTIEGTTRENMLDEWFGANVNDTRNAGISVDIVPIGFSHRRDKFAFSLATRVRNVQDITLNRGLMDLAFYGIDSDVFGSPSPVNMSLSTLTYSEISFGFAMELPIPLTGLIESVPFINGINIYAGVAPKYIVGLQAVDFDLISTFQVNTDPTSTNYGITHDFEYSLLSYGDLSTQLTEYSNARMLDPDAELGDYLDYDGSDIGTLGSGFGLDLGITAEVDVSIPALGALGKKQVLRISMAATDLGSITFDETPSRVSADGNINFNADAGDDDLEDYLDAFVDSLENDVYGGFIAEQLGDGSYDLPGMYNFGAALTLGKLTTTLDYGVGFNNVGINSARSSLTLGLEYRFFNFVPIRVGTRLGGYSSATYAFGFGLDFRYFELTNAISVVGNGGNDTSSIGVALSGLVFRF